MKEKIPHIIQRCKQGDRVAQKELYDMYAPLFLSIAMRYMKVKEEAEDVMVMAFFKIFDKIDSYGHQGSFEGWMKRIVVNEALQSLRKNKHFKLMVELGANDYNEEPIVLKDLAYQDIIEEVMLLPAGYRTIFNMYVIEGYKHREIAEKLGISINTSKSQLILAKKRLSKMLKKKDKYRIKGT